MEMDKQDTHVEQKSSTISHPEKKISAQARLIEGFNRGSTADREKYDAQMKQKYDAQASRLGELNAEIDNRVKEIQLQKRTIDDYENVVRSLTQKNDKLE